MAFICNDRVKETTATTGTGTITLAGAVTHFEAFSAIGNSNTTYYCIVHEDTNYDEWEVGYGVYTLSGTTLTRTAVTSSNSDSLVSFTAGTKSVFCTLPANKTVLKDSSGNMILGDGNATGFMTELSDDTTPQLGGDLDVDGNSIVSTSNANIAIAPNGTGEVVIGSGADGDITTSGAYDLILDTNSGTNSGSITITDAANGNIAIAPNGTGEVVIGSGAAGDITTSGAYDLILDTNSGTNSSNITITDGAGGDVTVNPNGAGDFVIAGNSTQAGTIVLGADTDDTGSFSASFAPGVLTESTAYTLPTAYAGTTGDVLASTDAGVLSWTTISGGVSWQAVVTGTTETAVAGEGYFINTTSNACTLTLPGSPSIGDEVNVIDYAGTFDTNNLTVAPAGSDKIHASTDDLTVATERAAFALVFSDSTQGWLLKDR